MPPNASTKTGKEHKGPGDTAIWDLQGSGDCGYRAIAAAVAVRNGKSKADVEKNISKMVTTCYHHQSSRYKLPQGAFALA